MKPTLQVEDTSLPEASSAKSDARHSATASSTGSLVHAWRTLSRSPGLATVCIGIITLAVSITLALVHWPEPSVHDEFSYLLASDTFAQGRLSNPTHPMWRYFESFHIIHEPSYASKYPPGQGLMLAVGQILTGYPLVGVWISMTLAVMALVWMLAGWMPWRWAIFGGLIFALHKNIQTSWGHSYWGGAVAFVGGAMLFGAYARLRNKPSIGNAVLLAVGAVVLAMSRPYEGFFACMIVVGMLIWIQLRSSDSSWKHFVTQLLLPSLVVLSMSLAGIGLYNRAVTGSPFLMPYAVHEATYGSSPLFVWQSPKPLPQYNHPSLQAFHEGWGLDAWRAHQTLLGFMGSKIASSYKLWSFFLGAILCTPVVLSIRRLGNRRFRFALSTLAGLYGTSLLGFWSLPHYFAPAGPLLFLVLVESVRYLRASARREWPIVRHAPGYLVAAQLVILLAAMFSIASNPGETWAEERAAIAEELSVQPGEHLVLVSYGPDHDVHQEWVYNGAELDGEKVLWARSFGPAGDQPLLNHFEDRKVWRLDVDVEPRRLELVSDPSLQKSSFGNSPLADPFADE